MQHAITFVCDHQVVTGPRHRLQIANKPAMLK